MEPYVVTHTNLIFEALYIRNSMPYKQNSLTLIQTWFKTKPTYLSLNPSLCIHLLTYITEVLHLTIDVKILNNTCMASPFPLLRGEALTMHFVTMVIPSHKMMITSTI